MNGPPARAQHALEEYQPIVDERVPRLGGTLLSCSIGRHPGAIPLGGFLTPAGPADLASRVPMRGPRSAAPTQHVAAAAHRLIRGGRVAIGLGVIGVQVE
jgi:hypothetical protein